MFSTVMTMVGNETAGGCGLERVLGAVLLSCGTTCAAGALVGGLLGEGDGDGATVALGLSDGVGLGSPRAAAERVAAAGSAVFAPVPEQPQIPISDQRPLSRRRRREECLPRCSSPMPRILIAGSANDRSMVRACWQRCDRGRRS